jgi:hypothetical protein
MTRKHDDAGTGEVQAKVDKAEDKGFFGSKVDPRPNEEYSLETGPDSPRAVEAPNTRLSQAHIDDVDEGK